MIFNQEKQPEKFVQKNRSSCRQQIGPPTRTAQSFVALRQKERDLLAPELWRLRCPTLEHPPLQLEDMGCSVGEYNINALELEDKMCIRKSEKRIEILHENKESSRGRSENEEGKAGKNKLWMRKVQPTKLGPSQQLLVNILLGKWLEMCSFWTKFTSKSCPNLTHRLILLHDFSVVVGQTPTKVYIFGNCD